MILSSPFSVHIFTQPNRVGLSLGVEILSVHLSICPSVCPFIHLSVFLFITTSVCLSIHCLPFPSPLMVACMIKIMKIYPP